MDGKKTFIQLVEEKKKRVLAEKEAPLKWQQKLEAAIEANERKNKTRKHKRRSTTSDSESSHEIKKSKRKSQKSPKKSKKHVHKKRRHCQLSLGSDDSDSSSDEHDDGVMRKRRRSRHDHHKRHRRSDSSDSESSIHEDGAKRYESKHHKHHHHHHHRRSRSHEVKSDSDRRGRSVGKSSDDMTHEISDKRQDGPDLDGRYADGARATGNLSADGDGIEEGQIV